jgi:glycosyltransferase involved in cell wall biosynthesis
MGKSTLFITWIEIWDDYWYEYIGKKGFLGKLVEKSALNLNSNWIAISNMAKEDLNRHNPEKPVTVIPMGIDTEEIDSIKDANENSDIIFAGRLIKEKNVDLLIRSIDMIRKIHPEVRCLIIGNGPERENLQKLCAELDLNNNITFMDFLEEHHQLISYIKSSKVFVLPSTREGFGIVVLEANACGKPVVVIDNKMNAACHLVQEGVNGFISHMDEESMMIKILEGLAEYDNMYMECIEMANKFDWNKIIPELMDVYHKSLKESFD